MPAGPPLVEILYETGTLTLSYLEGSLTMNFDGHVDRETLIEHAEAFILARWPEADFSDTSYEVTINGAVS